jgi:glycosyltransferase involved in cell wall biosynthesis
MEITLYIPCFNAEQHLSRAIDALQNQTYPVAQILIVDDGSSDRTSSIARYYRKTSRFPLDLLAHPSNLGLAAARNTAIENTHTKFVASLDSDVLPSPDWLMNMVVAFQRNPISGVGGNLIETQLTTKADLWRNTHMRQSWGTHDIMNPPFLYGSNTLFLKSALYDVGLYNPRYRTNYEDVDISMRLYQGGHSLQFLGKAECYHLRRDTTSSIVRTNWKWCSPKTLSLDKPNAILASNVRHLYRAIGYMVTDLQALRFYNLPIDIYMPLANTILDWKSYINSRV